MKTRIVLILAIAISCKANNSALSYEPDKISTEITALVESLIETDYIGTEKISRLPEASPAYANREALLTITTDEELEVLLTHPEGEVAATGFEGLVRRKKENLKEALFDLAKGDRKLNYIKGDLIFTMPALEYAYSTVLNIPFEGVEADGEPIDIGLTDDEKAFLENRIKAIRQTL